MQRTNASDVTTPVKKIKPEEPREPGARKYVAKKVIVDQNVDTYRKCGLFNNNSLLFCKGCGEKVPISGKGMEGSKLRWEMNRKL